MFYYPPMPKHNRIEYPVAQIREWIEVDGKTQQWIAEHLCNVLDPRVTAKLIYKVCKRHKIKCQRTGPRGGEGHPEWKGGRLINKDGYVQIHSPDHPTTHKTKKYVLEHRLVMEAHLGRYLTKDEVVHHKNGQKDDNRLENLELFASNAAHLRETLKGQCPQWTEDGLRRIKEGQKNRKNPEWKADCRKKRSRSARLRVAIARSIGFGGLANKQQMNHRLDEVGVTADEAYEMDDAPFEELLVRIESHKNGQGSPHQSHLPA